MRILIITLFLFMPHFAHAQTAQLDSYDVIGISDELPTHDKVVSQGKIVAINPSKETVTVNDSKTGITERHVSNLKMMSHLKKGDSIQIVSASELEQ